MTSIQLVYGDHELVLALPFDPQMEDQLLARLRKAEDSSMQAQLARRITDAITAAFEEPIPPTDKQLKYAASICRTLGLELPADCFQVQDSMRTFISRHAPEYQRRKGYRAGGSS